MPTNGLVVMTPSSVSVSSGTASINSDGSVTFSGCGNFTMENIFTADYDNYMLNIRFSHDGGDWDTFIRLRSGGVDNATSSAYTYQYMGATGTTVQSGIASSNYGIWGIASDDGKDGASIYFYGPYLAQPTAMRSVTALGHLTSRLLDNGITHNQSTSYDGIRLMVQSGTISGLVTVYGFNQ